MAKHRRVWNQHVCEQYIREGRGCGDGSGYSPWIHIQDFSSKGTVSRVKGRKTGRVHHLMSNNELAFFYILDWSDCVTDIREQYPLLDLDCAYKTAAEAGIRYPTDRASGYPYVMTCDFMVTTNTGFKARTIKQSAELNNPRTVEKLEIERRYWAKLGIDWKLVTENEIAYQKAKNIEWLYSTIDYNLADYHAETISSAKESIQLLWEASEMSVTSITKTAERQYSLGVGVGLILFKWLVLDKVIAIDLDCKLNLHNVRTEVAA